MSVHRSEIEMSSVMDYALAGPVVGRGNPMFNPSQSPWWYVPVSLAFVLMAAAVAYSIWRTARRHPKLKWKRLLIRTVIGRKPELIVWQPRGEWRIGCATELATYLLYFVEMVVGIWLAALGWPYLGALGWIALGVALFCAPGAWLLRRSWQRKSRWRSKHCIYCGYDLRASIRRCPECGHFIHGPAHRHVSPHVKTAIKCLVIRFNKALRGRWYPRGEWASIYWRLLYVVAWDGAVFTVMMLWLGPHRIFRSQPQWEIVMITLMAVPPIHLFCRDLRRKWRRPSSRQSDTGYHKEAW